MSRCREGLTTDEQTWLDLGAQTPVWGPLRLYANLRHVLDERDLVSRRPLGRAPIHHVGCRWGSSSRL